MFADQLGHARAQGIRVWQHSACLQGYVCVKTLHMHSVRPLCRAPISTQHKAIRARVVTREASFRFAVLRRYASSVLGSSVYSHSSLEGGGDEAGLVQILKKELEATGKNDKAEK